MHFILPQDSSYKLRFAFYLLSIQAAILIKPFKKSNNVNVYTVKGKGLPWWSSGQDLTLFMQGACVQPLVRELEPTCHS